MLRQSRLAKFYQELATPSYKSPSFGHSYSSRNILPRISHPIIQKPQFWSQIQYQKYFTQIFPAHHTKALGLVNPTIVEICYQDFPTPSYKSSSFGKSYSTRNILPGFFEPLTSTGRLSTVSSPYMVNNVKNHKIPHRHLHQNLNKKLYELCEI